MSDEIKCNKCGEDMKNLGNLSGIVMLSYPEQWDDVYVCEKCKERKTVRKKGAVRPDYSQIWDYPEQSNSINILQNNPLPPPQERG